MMLSNLCGKWIPLAILVTLMLLGCGGQDQQNTELSDSNSEEPTEYVEIDEVVEEDVYPSQKLVEELILGEWRGQMGGKELVFVIDEVSNNDIVGTNQLGTNQRPVKGTWENQTWDEPCSFAIVCRLEEPGDDKWDGVFTITFIGYNESSENEDGVDCIPESLVGSEAQGTWVSNNGQLNHELFMGKSELQD
jgi:hypothetical protein